MTSPTLKKFNLDQDIHQPKLVQHQSREYCGWKFPFAGPIQTILCYRDQFTFSDESVFSRNFIRNQWVEKYCDVLGSPHNKLYASFRPPADNIEDYQERAQKILEFYRFWFAEKALAGSCIKSVWEDVIQKILALREKPGIIWCDDHDAVDAMGLMTRLMKLPDNYDFTQMLLECSRECKSMAPTSENAHRSCAFENAALIKYYPNTPIHQHKGTDTYVFRSQSGEMIKVQTPADDISRNLFYFIISYAEKNSLSLNIKIKPYSRMDLPGQFYYQTGRLTNAEFGD